MLCTVNGQDIIQNSADGTCPKGYFDKPSGVRFTPPPKPPRRILPRPGEVLAKIIKSATGIDPEKVDPVRARTNGCGACKSLQAEMDKNGWFWCYFHRAEIIAQVKLNAAEHGIQIDSDSLCGLIRAGFREWRKHRV
jgi:hypothetical protein